MLSCSGVLRRVPYCLSLAMAVLLAWIVSVLPANAASSIHFSYAKTNLGGGFQQPSGLAVDGNGNIYIANYQNSSVQQMPTGCASASCVKTLGGGFRRPTAVAVDADGNVYVADYGNGAVKKMPAGCASTRCVTTVSGDFDQPRGLALDTAGNLYISDAGDNSVKRIAVSCSRNCVSTLATGLLSPWGVAVDSGGNVYVADNGHNSVKKVAAHCNRNCVTTVATGFNNPTSLALDNRGNLYVADTDHETVKMIALGCTGSGCVTTPLGSGFTSPRGLAVDASGNVYVGEMQGTRVEEFQMGSVNFLTQPVGQTSAPVELTFTFDSSATLGPLSVFTAAAPNLDYAAAAGGSCVTGERFRSGDTCTVNLTFTPEYPGQRNGAVELTSGAGVVQTTAYVYGTGSGPQAAFNPAILHPLADGLPFSYSVAVDGVGNAYVADPTDGVILGIPQGCASADCVATLVHGFNRPYGVAVDAAGNLYVAASYNNKVQEIAKGCTDSSCGITLGGGLSLPMDVAVDGAGNVYAAVSATGNAVKEIPKGCFQTDCVVSLGGGFDHPQALAVGADGNLYVADTENNAVKKIPAGCTSTGCVQTLGGGFQKPTGVAADAAGNVYVASLPSGKLRVIPPGCASSSCVTTVDLPGRGIAALALGGGGDLYAFDAASYQVLKLDLANSPGLSFASTSVGSTSADSPLAVTVMNIGNQELSFPLPTGAGAYNPGVPAHFSYSNGSTCEQKGAGAGAAFTLDSGASCTIAINFTPGEAGSISGNILLTDDSLNAAAPEYLVQKIPLSGTAVEVVAQLAFDAAPPSSIVAGDNVGTLTVVEQDSEGSTLTTAADSITLTVAGPNGYSKTYTKIASSGVATFDLSSVALESAGSYTFVAAVSEEIQVTASLSVSAGAAATVSAVSGSGQSAVIGADFAEALVVRVEDRYGNPVSGATVSFTPPDGGAGAALSTPAATGDDGETSVIATANTIASLSAYQVTAALSGTDSAATFSLTNTRAELTVTADNSSKVYGTANPAFTGSVSGAVGQDTFEESYSTAATASSDTGTYSIIPDVTGSNLESYSLQIVNGTLTVTQAATATSLSADSSAAHPGQDLTLTAQVTDASPGSTGTPTGTVSFYDGTTLLGTSSLSDGAATYTLSGLSVGTTLSLTATYSGDTNFTQSGSSSTVSIPVVPLDFTMSGGDGGQTQSVIPGGSVNYSFLVSPTFGVFPAAVTFSAAGLPPGAVATFSPSTIDQNAGPTGVIMTIHTQAQGGTAANRNPFRHGGAPLALGFLLFPLLGLRRIRKTLLARGLLTLALMVTGLAGIASLSGCGDPNGYFDHAPTTYTVTVTATSGAAQHSFDVNLNLQ